MPTLETINVGQAPNDKKGDPLRNAMQKVVLNFTTLNSAIQGVLDGKGRANGYASLGADGKVPIEQIPAVLATQLPATPQDLNAVIDPGDYFINSSGIAGGSNLPPGLTTGGIIRVTRFGNAVEQTVTAYNVGARRWWRMRTSSTIWSDWQESANANAAIPIAQKGAANGVAELDSSGKLPSSRIPAPTLLPTVAHDLDTYDQDGVYGQNATAGAVAGSHYPPEAVAGVLTVQRGGAGNIQVHQWYRTYFTENSTIYYRNKTGVGWGGWVRLAKFSEAMTHTYLGVPTDCNTLASDNTFYTFSSGSIMTSGTNWPPAGTNIAGGSVEVMWYSTTRAVQTVTLIVGGQKPRIYTRDGNPTTLVWNAWKIISSVSSAAWLPTADAGDVYVDGVGWYAWNGSAYARRDLSVLLPIAAHSLDTYTDPGEFYQGSTSSATVANKYPEGAALGFLTVKSYGTATLQEYTSRASASRKWWRSQVSAGTWTAWFEVADTGKAMTHTYLSAATDANTLTADNTFYTWVNSTVGGSANFPTFTTAWPAAGYMRVYWNAATQVCQELTYIRTGEKPRTFARFGNTTAGTWQPWKSTSDWSIAVGLPTSDMGDIYVDGVGTYAWDGVSYKLTFAGRDHGQCRFDFVSITQCRLTPYDGNGLLINGKQYRIPAAGVSIANTAFTPQTLMYVYAYDNGSGAIALEASVTGFSIGGDGVATKTGDATRTVVGMAITPANGQFTYNNTLRYVSSYFNRRPMTVLEYIGASTSSLNNPVAMNSGCGCLVWGGSVLLHVSGQANANLPAGAYLSVRVNGSAALGGWGYSCPGPGAQISYSMIGPWYASPGLVVSNTFLYTNVSGSTINITQDQGITYEG